MRRLLPVLLLLVPAEALAGYCLSEAEREEEAKRLEAIARAGKIERPEGPAVLWCVVGGSGEAAPSAAAPYRRRVTAACTRIAPLKAGYAGDLVDACVDFLVEHGTVKAGTTDLVAKLLARPAGPWDQPNLRVLGASKDPRARAHVAEKLRDAFAKVGKLKLAGWKRNAWVNYRLDAFAALEHVGTTADLALIDEVAAASKEPKVVAAAKRARDRAASRP